MIFLCLALSACLAFAIKMYRREREALERIQDERREALNKLDLSVWALRDQWDRMSVFLPDTPRVRLARELALQLPSLCFSHTIDSQTNIPRTIYTREFQYIERLVGEVNSTDISRHWASGRLQDLVEIIQMVFTQEALNRAQAAGLLKGWH